MSESPLAPEQFGSAFKAFMDAVVREARPPAGPLLDRIRDHLGADPAQLPVTTEEYDRFEHPNLQVALNAYAEGADREVALVGVAANTRRFMEMTLSDLLTRVDAPGWPGLVEGPVDYVTFRLAGDQTLACVQFGIYLISQGERRIVALVSGPVEHHGPRPVLRLEVMAARQEDGKAFVDEINAAMLRLNVYRGHVISLSPGDFSMGPQTLIAFHELPEITQGDLILPPELLERIERQTVLFAEQSEALLAAGRSLKRGMLLHGPPGTGKTLTIMYLTVRMPGRTVILTTGLGMGLLRPAVQMARQLAPSMVVLEDVDLIAQERSNPWHGGGPLLFELLNEMDGLQEDSDVVFVLTSNRPETLEPALAARPGRIDLVVELPLPDAEGRRALIQRYARGLELRDIDEGDIIARTDGTTPAYIKELFRKAALLALTGNGDTMITQEILSAALDELASGGDLARRLTGMGGVTVEVSGEEQPAPSRWFPQVHGYSPR